MILNLLNHFELDLIRFVNLPEKLVKLFDNRIPRKPSDFCLIYMQVIVSVQSDAFSDSRSLRSLS